MHVEVNETNIAVFELVQMTGNSREVLLNAAAEAAKKGYILHCQIPDPEDPIEVNAFEHFESEKAPDVSDEVNTFSNRCRYELLRSEEGPMIWFCIIHHAKSKHHIVGEDSQAQCLFLDPRED
jgi:hypothetical protein